MGAPSALGETAGVVEAGVNWHNLAVIGISGLAIYGLYKLFTRKS